MASAIHLMTETSDFTSANAVVICDVCRKHVDLPSQCRSACSGHESPLYESIEKHPSTNKYAGHFDCNICLDGCRDPVVTQCGHLFCWPCLYFWLSLHSVSKECPVCKANVQDKIVPLYGCGKAEHSMNSTALMFPNMLIPCRPLRSRSRSDVPVATNTIIDPDHGERNHAIQDHETHTDSANVSFFASMLRCGMTSLRNGASILARRVQRFSNEKEFVLHWAFIFVASIAILCFIVC